MRTRTKIILAGAAVTVAAVAGGGVAIASSDDTEAPITGDAYDKASDAALNHVGEGRVTDTEVGDEESYYEVEVTRDDGTQVDVQLDESFTVVGSEPDDDTTEDSD